MVSGWVPVVTALAALLGVVVGQYWQAKREDARWVKERKEREEQWEREDHLRSFEYKREIYAQFLSQLLLTMTDVLTVDPSKPLPQNVKDQVIGFRKSLGALFLMAPSDITDEALRLTQVLGRAIEIASKSGDPSTVLAEAGSQALRLAMLKDLGVATNE